MLNLSKCHKIKYIYIHLCYINYTWICRQALRTYYYTYVIIYVTHLCTQVPKVIEINVGIIFELRTVALVFKNHFLKMHIVNLCKKYFYCSAESVNMLNITTARLFLR